MAKDIFDKRVERWLIDRPSKRQRFTRGIQAIYYNRRPRSFRWMALLHWLSKTAVASSAPAVAFFIYKSITFWQGAAATAAIAAGHSFVTFLDQMSKAKKTDVAGGEAELVVRFGEVIAGLESKVNEDGDTDDSIRATLGIIEIVARRITKASKGDISVSLAMYNGNSSDELKIRHRNPGNERPIGKKFSGRYVLGHHACQAGSDPRVVHNLPSFGKLGMKSPTQSDAKYRSIYIIPISRKHNETSTICGFISIDSTRAYAFYANRANTIIIVCEPFIQHIQDLL